MPVAVITAYGSVDAALWFARAVLLYERAGGDEARLRDEYETQKYVLSRDALQEREIELLKHQRNLERDLQEAQEEFEIEQRKLMQPILKHILETVQAIARDRGLVVVLEKTSPGVLFYSETLDITDEVIQRLNES